MLTENGKAMFPRIKKSIRDRFATNATEIFLMTPVQNCLQCGICCEKWGWGQKGVIEDLIPWIQKDRQGILEHVLIRFANGKRCTGRNLSEDDLPRIVRIDYWTDSNGKAVTSCPFFWRAEDGKVYCKIHDTKPKVCIGFTPWNEGIRDYALNCPACQINAP